jgi:hypothetical protein
MPLPKKLPLLSGGSSRGFPYQSRAKTAAGGPLSHLLRNRFFIGEVNYRGEILPGEQPAIVDKSLFEAVQHKLSAHQSHKTLTRQKSDHLLRDLLFDDAGHRMIATHATKAGVRYRYYVSQPSVHGEARTARLGSVSRVPASEIEQAVVAVITEQLRHQNSPTDRPQPIKFDRKVLGSLVGRIGLADANRSFRRAGAHLRCLAKTTFKAIPGDPSAARDAQRKHPARARRTTCSSRDRDRTRSPLARPTTGAVTDAHQLAKRERCTVRQVNLTLSLAFLAPQLVKAAVEGRLPRGINLERLRHPHAEWNRQFQELGLDPH